VARQSQCLFCERRAGSREHLWAAWIHERLLRKQPIRITFAGRPVTYSNNPEITVKTVCGICNNGWMSNLEADCIPLLGSLMQGLSVPLDPSQQSLISTWAVKTAMVLDSTNTRARSLFYSRAECGSLRVNRTIPDRTRVWIGRSGLDGLLADGTIVTIQKQDGVKIAFGSPTTFVVGHVALQVFTIHPLAGFESLHIDPAPRPGQWEKLLVELWPTKTYSVNWPPLWTFTGNGIERHIGQLLFRWRMGQPAQHSPA
jgi:hypothetical protein